MEKFEILLYTAPEGNASIEVFFENETFWLSQKKMAELFGVDIRTVNEHLQNIFATNELDKNSVIRIFRITAADGKNYNTQFYHLDAIIAVGYRVNSREATRFRIWATHTLREYIIKGFVMDDDRLKQDVAIAKNYLQEEEIDELNRIVTMYLDYAENQAKRNIPMNMADWVKKLDAFLQFNDYEVLKDAGKVRHEVALSLAEKEFEKFRVLQDKNYESDFDKLIQKLPASEDKRKKKDE